MKLQTRLSCLFLCLALLACFAGCGDQTPDATDPTTATLPPISPRNLYSAARRSVDNATNLRLVIAMEETRTVGSETYTHTANTVASYAGLNTDTPSAVVDEKLTFGTYTNNYKTFYRDGVAYAQTMDYAFSAEMSAEAFLAGQIPAVLLDASLYRYVIAEEGASGTTIHFSNPYKLENWVLRSRELQLVSAEGTALINKSGTLLSTSYTAQYLMGDIPFSLSVSVTVSTPKSMDLSSQFSDELAVATPIDHFDAPRNLLQAVGDICATENLSAGYTETLYCQAADSIREQQVQVTTQGSGSSFSATVDYTAILTNYAGLSETNTQVETYNDGAYTYSINGSKPTVLQTVSAQQMRTYCEDTVLTALLSIDYLANAQLIDEGTAYKLQLVGTEAMAEDLCDNIFAILDMNLDLTADSYTTNSIGGYLLLDKATGLPTAASIFLTRTHVIGGASYTMTYELNETMELIPQ